MCSLPFFTYGIALGDEVSTDETLTIDGVVRRSGHHLLRVAVERDAAERFHLSRLTEWLDPRALAGKLRYEDG
jgi:hypothetical protein